ncbi:hypothetical protein [Legionella pneumophila]|uniref:hypothetical protein n=1 Tax=Legionella pneumophila TaxID=446 RepID=UPI0005C433A6|nr:hypothetical protein [Legionella pneumophila]GAN30968.1 hypothetical protein lpymt_02583 [Legionella pneumophila]
MNNLSHTQHLTIAHLKVLCVKCHADEPNHGHMKHGRDYKQFLRIYEQVKQNN